MYSGLCSARIYSLLKKSKTCHSEARCVPRNPSFSVRSHPERFLTSFGMTPKKLFQQASQADTLDSSACSPEGERYKCRGTNGEPQTPGSHTKLFRRFVNWVRRSSRLRQCRQLASENTRRRRSWRRCLWRVLYWGKTHSDPL